MRLKKHTLTEETSLQGLTDALVTACRMGYLDCKKKIKEKDDGAILKALCDQSIVRHEKSLLAAYKMGFEQAANLKPEPAPVKLAEPVPAKKIRKPRKKSSK